MQTDAALGRCRDRRERERDRREGGREGVELACTDLHLLFGHNERGEDWRGVRVFL